MSEQEQNSGADWNEDAPALNAQAPAPVPEQPAPDYPAAEQPAPEQPAPAPEAPTRVLEEPAEPALPPNPVASLRQAFRDLAALVGQAKADFILVEFYGVTSPDALRAAELLDAIDKLYDEAA